jgi:hypothetical protein
VTCLVCTGPLTDHEGQAQCPRCGFWYPGELLADANPDDWAKIQREGLACLACEQLLPGLPRVHADRDGQPTACPVHARRSWWRRLFRR